MSDKSDQGNAKTGVVPGIIACVFAVLGIFTMGMLFVPLAAIVTLVGTIIAAKNAHGVASGSMCWPGF